MALDYRQLQYVALFRHLARAGQVGRTRRELAADMGASLRTVAALADEMMARGYIRGCVRHGEPRSPWRYWVNHPDYVGNMGE